MSADPSRSGLQPFRGELTRTEPARTEPTRTELTRSEPTRAETRALRVVQAGAILVVLAVSLYRSFELDRFFVPKELTLHLTALTAGLLMLRALRRSELALIDLLLILFLLLGIASAVGATNHWFALRALAVSASGILLFWVARTLSEAGRRRGLLGAVALAVVLGCATSLLQAYGVRSDFFSLNRAPGGALGNRNFVAHMAAFGLPVIVLVALRARHWAGFVAAALGATLVTGTLVLTRSRAGFLALAAVLAVFAAAPVLSSVLRRSAPVLRRLAGIVVLAGAGVGAAVALPNELRWRSDNPYLESITGVANFQEGSGRGRLVQYRQSLAMSLDHPLLGVGAGNWAVEYPAFAARRDPSLSTSEAGTTSNPWPSSDWIAFVSERGLPAAVVLAIIVLGIAIGGLRRLTNPDDADDALYATALLAVLGAAIVAGAFDAVLLLALPVLLVSVATGALYTPPERRPAIPAGIRAAVVITLLLITAAGAVRSSAQLAVMAVYENVNSATWLSRAAILDPANYRLRVRLARSGSGLDREARCRHARAAHDLLPHAQQARSLSRRCDD